MKSLLLTIVLALCLVSGANAHNGMLVLYSDTQNHNCHGVIGTYQSANIYLMYDRGNGPRMGNAYEFRLLKSTSQAVFLTPTWPTSVPPMGTIETGISITTADCFPDQAYVPLGTIPMLNIADPDTFTVKVVEDPTMLPPRGVVILKCDAYGTMYYLPGGTFVFNGSCYEPLDPWGTVAVRETTWGAIKELYR